METNSCQTIDEYIALAPESVQGLLEEMRGVIRAAAPDATEVISYQMPAFRMPNGVLVYFASAKNHIGFYPTASGVVAFKDAITGYKSSKGAIQFPLDKPLPFDLIAEITRFRVQELAKKQKSSPKKKG